MSSSVGALLPVAARHFMRGSTMFRWLTGQPKLHLYTGYVSARRPCANGTIDTALAPYAVVSATKTVALVQGASWIRQRCPIEEGWVEHRAELICIPDFMLRKPQIAALGQLVAGLDFDGTIETLDIQLGEKV
jgi:hypothetical protein